MVFPYFIENRPGSLRRDFRDGIASSCSAIIWDACVFFGDASFQLVVCVLAANALAPAKDAGYTSWKLASLFAFPHRLAMSSFIISVPLSDETTPLIVGAAAVAKWNNIRGAAVLAQEKAATTAHALRKLRRAAIREVLRAVWPAWN